MTAKVLVTAGASGIGLEIVRAFVGSGATVYTCDIDSSALDAAASEMPGLHIGRCDIGKRSEIDLMVAQAGRTRGGIDVLVNNAGIGGPTKPVQDIDPDDWDAVLRIDLTGTFDVTRNAIPYLIRSDKGSIINMSSAAAALDIRTVPPMLLQNGRSSDLQRHSRWSLANSMCARTRSRRARWMENVSKRFSEGGRKRPVNPSNM